MQIRGIITVIFEIEKYNELVLNFLDNKTFSLICEDSPLQKLIKIETHFILALKNNPKTKDLAINYQPNTLNLAKIYGTMKCHKTPLTIRPIISTIGAPGHMLGMAFNKILTRIFPPTKQHIRVIQYFKDEIDDIAVVQGEVLVSFDIVGMYSNIPPDLVIQIINRNIQKFKNSKTYMTYPPSWTNIQYGHWITNGGPCIWISCETSNGRDI